MTSKVVSRAERTVNSYSWNDDVSRRNFIRTIVIRDQTIDATKRRWQSTANANPAGNAEHQVMYREEVDTINARFLVVLTDLLRSATPL